MRNLYILVMGFVTSMTMSCEDHMEKRPMKFMWEGVIYQCYGYFIAGTLTELMCYDNNGAMIIKEYYLTDGSKDSSIIYYPTGGIKEHGKVQGSFKKGVWKKYNEDGTLIAYRYYHQFEDTFNLFYEKLYNEDGDLYALRYPIRFRTDADDSDYIVGNTYQLWIDLKYSEYDSVYSMGYFHASPLSGVEADTVVFDSLSLYLKFTPQQPGKHAIEGTFVELDATGKETNHIFYIELEGKYETLKTGYGGERFWRFEYEAIERRKGRD